MINALEGTRRRTVMSQRYRLGLVVGKFAPLHRGHEWLVAQAERVSDRLLILSYTQPEFAHCGVPARQRWLQQCFPGHATLVFDDACLQTLCNEQGIAHRSIPDNSAKDEKHHRFLAWLLGDVLHQKPDAFFSSESYGLPCAAYLSQALGHTVMAVVFDLDRAHVPISASQIRSSPLNHLGFLSPYVRADFTPRIAILGGESSGKTTLAARLAVELGTVWVAEIGREVWEEQQGVLSEDDLLNIARQQIQREQDALYHAHRFLICDTTPLTTAGYALWMFGRVCSELAALAERTYDATLLCEPDFPFVQDGTRQDNTFRLRQHAWYLERLQHQQCPQYPLLHVEGTLERRTSHAVAWLRGLYALLG